LMDRRSASAQDLQRHLHQTIKKISDDFSSRWHFNTSISALMELNNAILGRKTDIESGNIPAEDLAQTKRTLVLLLAPFAPYLAHELWEFLGEKGPLLRAPWPKFDPALAKEDEIEIPVQINGKLRGLIRVSAEASKDAIRDHALADEKIKALIAGKEVKNIIIVLGRLINIVVK